MHEGKQSKSRTARLAGLGVELVAVVLGFSLFGAWIDRRYGSAPWGVVVAALLGLVGGMLNFLRAALAAVREMGEEKRS